MTNQEGIYLSNSELLELGHWIRLHDALTQNTNGLNEMFFAMNKRDGGNRKPTEIPTIAESLKRTAYLGKLERLFNHLEGIFPGKVLKFCDVPGEVPEAAIGAGPN
jgi:hypothetical protein